MTAAHERVTISSRSRKHVDTCPGSRAWVSWRVIGQSLGRKGLQPVGRSLCVLERGRASVVPPFTDATSPASTCDGGAARWVNEFDLCRYQHQRRGRPIGLLQLNCWTSSSVMRSQACRRARVKFHRMSRTYHHWLNRFNSDAESITCSMWSVQRGLFGATLTGFASPCAPPACRASVITFSAQFELESLLAPFESRS